MKEVFRKELEASIVSLNKYINSNRKNKYAGNNQKQSLTRLYRLQLQNEGRIELKNSKIVMIWKLKDKRMDPDNVAFNKKFVLDGMVNSGLIEDDRHKHIGGFEDIFEYGHKQQKVEIIIYK